MENLGRKHFRHTVTVNLERNPDWHRVFERNLDAIRIISELEILTGQKIKAGETLLFIDEIQACPNAIMALRYIFEELPDLHVAGAGSLLESFDVQAEICETYRLDFAKYRPQADKNCLNAVLSSVARSVGRQIKYARLADGYSNPTLRKAFELLCLARIVRKIPSADPSGLPLGARASDKVFKALLVDIGLMRFLTGMPVEVRYGKIDLLDIYRGALAEQFVGQEMALTQQAGIFYWSRRAKSSSAEVDFIAVVNGKVVPIEVKSGSAGRLKSLGIFLQTYPKSPGAIVLSTQPYRVVQEKKITYMPLYYAFSATRNVEATPALH